MHKETKLAETTATNIKTETLFVVLSLNVKRRNLATSSSSQFYCCWGIFTLIKYSSFLGLENVRSVLRIWGQKIWKLTLHLINVAEIDVYGN